MNEETTCSWLKRSLAKRRNSASERALNLGGEGVGERGMTISRFSASAQIFSSSKCNALKCRVHTSRSVHKSEYGDGLSAIFRKFPKVNVAR